jgi:hypothetical protein
MGDWPVCELFQEDIIQILPIQEIPVQAFICKLNWQRQFAPIFRESLPPKEIDP